MSGTPGWSRLVPVMRGFLASQISIDFRSTLATYAIVLAIFGSSLPARTSARIWPRAFLTSSAVRGGISSGCDPPEETTRPLATPLLRPNSAARPGFAWRTHMPFFAVAALHRSPDFFFALHLAFIGLLTVARLVQGRVGAPRFHGWRHLRLLFKQSANGHASEAIERVAQFFQLRKAKIAIWG